MIERSRWPLEAIAIVAANILLVGISWGLITAKVDNLHTEIMGLKETLASQVVMKEENNLWRMRYEERHLDHERRIIELERKLAR